MGDVAVVDTENKLHQQDMEDIHLQAEQDTVWSGRQVGIQTQEALLDQDPDHEDTVGTEVMVIETIEATAVNALEVEATVGVGQVPAALTTQGQRTLQRLTRTLWRPWTGMEASTTLVSLVMEGKLRLTITE